MSYGNPPTLWTHQWCGSYSSLYAFLILQCDRVEVEPGNEFTLGKVLSWIVEVIKLPPLDSFEAEYTILSIDVKWSNKGRVPFFTHITYQFHYKHSLMKKLDARMDWEKVTMAHSTCCMYLPVLQKTPASSLGTQLWTPNPLCRHCVRFTSFPVQSTLSNRIKPAPGPKCGMFVAFAPDMEVCT